MTAAHPERSALASPRLAADGLPELLDRILGEFRNAACLNERQGDRWVPTSTEDLAQGVRRFALGLREIGLRQGDCVGLMARPSPFWVMADLAIMAAGGVTVPLFADLSSEHLDFEIRDAPLRFVIAEGEAAWQALAPHLRNVERVIGRGIIDRDKKLSDHRDVLRQGDGASTKDPRAWRRLIDRCDPDDLATIIYTSGSTGVPKGVELTHRNLLVQIAGAAQRFPLDPGRDRALSCLPLAHVFERMVLYSYLAQGVSVSFVDNIKKVGELMRDLKPTVITMVPRLLEKVYARMQQGVEKAGLLTRGFARWALDSAATPENGTGWRHAVADKLIYRNLRSALGGKLRYVIVGGAALAPDMATFFTGVGIPIYTGYGLTEAAPVLAANCPAANRIGSVGQAFPGVELRIGPQDEILARGPNVMRGYHGANATTVAVDADGWLHTGDRGRIDEDGYLWITGRIKELLKSSNGKYITPGPIEQLLCRHELVDMALVIGDNRPFASCLLWPDRDALERWKQAHGLRDADDLEVLVSEPVRASIEAHLREVNARLDHWENVRTWRFVTEAPTVAGGEITPTMKIKRHVVEQKYRDLIDGIYAGAQP